MNSESHNCGLSSLLPMSCRHRAEGLARSLHSRLSSLGSQDGIDSNDETSWLGGNENHISLSQPRHHTLESDVYLKSGLLESPESLHQNDDVSVINKDNLRDSHTNEYQCPSVKSRKETFQPSASTMQNFNASNDSDNESFYDTENDLENQSTNYLMWDANSQSSRSETGIYLSSQESSGSTLEEQFQTSSDCTPEPSLIEDQSTVSQGEPHITVLGINALSGEESVCNDKSNGTHDAHYIQWENFTRQLTIEKDIANARFSQNFWQVELQVTNFEDYDEYNKIPRVRRCSSLKTGKTPPNTPGRKKIVRFADVLGLDLADIRMFLDEIPKVPNSAFKDLGDVDLDNSFSELINPSTSNQHKFHGITIDKILAPLFQQPGGMPNFLDLVRDNKVCLENALVNDPIILSIKGTVRVRNLDFHKTVHIRYSLDSWKTYADVKAIYVENSCDGFSDKFSFSIYANTLTIGHRLEFACRFSCRGCQYWDNNNGINYCFQCLSSVYPAQNYSPAAPNVDHWGASFY